MSIYLTPRSRFPLADGASRRRGQCDPHDERDRPSWTSARLPDRRLLGRRPQTVEHLVDQHDQLMGGQVHVDVIADLAELLRLGEVRAESLPEPVELAELEVARRRVAERAAPEADLDLRLEVPSLVQR